MQANIVWAGLEYNSLENCVVDTNKQGTEIKSTIVGTYQHTIYKVEYRLKTNKNWEIIFVDIKAQLKNKAKHFIFAADSKGNWTMSGKPAKRFKGCIDVDITLTPFTNSLPINRLKLNTGESHQIKVLYFDLLELKVKSVNQKYIKCSKTKYKFENVPNDFEAVLKIDKIGLVDQYPGLFKRVAIQKTKYR